MSAQPQKKLIPKRILHENFKIDDTRIHVKIDVGSPGPGRELEETIENIVSLLREKVPIKGLTRAIYPNHSPNEASRLKLYCLFSQNRIESFRLTENYAGREKPLSFHSPNSKPARFCFVNGRRIVPWETANASSAVNPANRSPTQRDFLALIERVGTTVHINETRCCS